MSEFYDEMAEMVTELLTEEELGQSGIYLVKVTPGVPDPAQPWVPVTPVVERIGLRGVAKRVHYRYINGTLVSQTGDVVTFAVPSPEVELTEFELEINGERRAITDLRRIPSAGTPVAYQAWCQL